MRAARPSYAQLVSAAAVALSLASGAAYASHEVITASDIVDDAVRSRHIAAANVATTELATDAVTEPKVAPGSVDGSRIDDGEVRSQDLGSNAVAAAEVPGNALTGAVFLDASVGGDDVDEGTLDRFSVFEGADGADAVCSPQTATFQLCNSVTIPAGHSQVLAIAVANWASNFDSGGSRGSCEIQLDGTTIEGTSIGEHDETTDENGHGNHAVLADVAAIDPAQTHALTMRCNETEDRLRYLTELAAVAR